jgi:hypothetical protein
MLIIWHITDKKITYFMGSEGEKTIFEAYWDTLANLLNALSQDGWKICTHTIENEIHFWSLQRKKS